MSEPLKLRVVDIVSAAKDVLVLSLRHPDGSTLPSFTPGAHIDVHLPTGIVRQYSLCNDSRQCDQYQVGVSLAVASRGGSSYIHESLKVGDLVTVSAPRNNFPMNADAAKHVFFAGGIGITPIYTMIQWCVANDRPWHLYYLVRSRDRAAFLDALGAHAQNVTLHVDDEAGHVFDVRAAVAGLAASSHLYTCGPDPLMLAVEAAATDLPPANVHFEWFVPKVFAKSACSTAFTVTLASSGVTLDVPPEKSILEVLETNGIRVENSCREGTCASCETRVISGVPEHRDSVLSDDEKSCNETMMVCVSRALSKNLVLDL